MAPRLLVVGGGKMGSALLGGLIAGKWASVEELAVSDPDPGQRERLANEHPGLTVVDAPIAADGAIVAVKPDVAEAVLRTLSAVGIKRFLSIVAGLSSARLEAVLQPDDVVVRAMPNTPSLVGAGVAGMSGGSMARAADLDWAEGILGSVGTVVRLPERQLDAVTGVSGSGPAYVFLMAEAMIEGGVSAGLTREVSRQLVVGTLLGSARMLDETGGDPGDLRAAVTSPGGTTQPSVRSSWVGRSRCRAEALDWSQLGRRTDPALTGGARPGHLLPLGLRECRRVRGRGPRRSAPDGPLDTGHRPLPSGRPIRRQRRGSHAGPGRPIPRSRGGPGRGRSRRRIGTSSYRRTDRG
jgi:pyrroline-5-carboxylate reductase